MKKRLKTLLIAIQLITAITFTAYLTKPLKVQAQETPNITIEPSLYHAEKLGEIFSVTVKLYNLETTDKAVGIQFRVTYNTSLVEALNVTEGSFLEQFNNTGDLPYTYFVGYIEDDAIYGPNVLVGILLVPNATGCWTNFPYGSGTLATITFKAIYRPVEPDTATCPLNLTDTMIMDENLQEIDHTTTSATYEAEMLPLPELTVQPSIYQATHIGEKFNVDVNISGLDSDWSLVGIQFRLQYNATILEALNVTEGSFLEQFNNTGDLPYTYFVGYIEDDAIYGPNVLVGILLVPNATGCWTNFPYGSGTLATITFNSTYQPMWPKLLDYSYLKLNDTMLMDSELAEIPHELEHGYYEIASLPVSTLQVSPQITNATHRGQLVTVNIDIKDLILDWKTVGVQFRLTYDPTILEVVDVIEGPFLEQFNNTGDLPYTFFVDYVEDDPIYGPNVLVGILILPNGTGCWTNFAYGDGTLATITFEVIQGPPASCVLGLNDTMLMDPNLAEAPHIIQNGSYRIAVETLYHEVIWEEQSYTVVTESNVTVNPIPLCFDQTHRALYFNITGPEGIVGYCNITMPKELLDASPDDWLVLVGGQSAQYEVSENATHTFLYFTCSMSTHPVYILGTQVIPEFPTAIVPVIFVTLTILMAALAKFTQLKKRETYQAKPKNNYHQ
jgi:hypothetical protein